MLVTIATGSQPDEWDKRVVDDGIQFHRWFLRKKLEHLKREYAFVLPEDELSAFITVTVARNCLVHRDGIVFDEDKNGPEGLHVRWRAPRVSVANPNAETRVVTSPGTELKLGGSFVVEQHADHEKVFPVGKRVGFSTQELSEIGAFLSSFTNTTSHLALRWAQEKVGIFKSG